MRGHIIAEERFFHQGIDHHLFVMAIDGAENGYRFEVRRILPGNDQYETEYEKTIDFSSYLEQAQDTPIEQLIQAELQVIIEAVNAEEDTRAHDP